MLNLKHDSSENENDNKEELVKPEKEQQIVGNVFKKLTTNPNQMSLFEIRLRNKIRKLIFERTFEF